jgi:hypothetical protein
MKTKNHLKTVPPETLNWFKDYDVTWLYGPRQTEGKKVEFTSKTPPPLSYLASLTSLPKKSILKRNPSFVCPNMSTQPDCKHVQFDQGVRQMQAVDPEGDVKTDDDRDRQEDELWQRENTSTNKQPPYAEGDSDDDPVQPMRGTESGTCKQYIKDKEEDTVNDTLFGQAMYAVNTFRDIAYVLLTVGWNRK